MMFKDSEERKENLDEQTAEKTEITTEEKKENCCDSSGDCSSDGCCKTNNDIDSSEKEQSDAKDQSQEHLEMLQRLAAEFDNYKKRTCKEKESLYIEATRDVILELLPVLDNLERASQVDNSGVERLKEGIDMVLKQFKEVLKNIGVEEIPAEGEQFDPEIHSAVMHVESEEYGNNVVIEELQKGYKIKDRVIRYSVVKVAN